MNATYCVIVQRQSIPKKAKWDESPSDENRAEYYLAIEGFLLHFRNLLGFFINKRMAETDLTINRPQQWADGRTMDAALCKRLTERASTVNREYGLSIDVNCYRKISWFLQHCTDHRYRLDRGWDIEGMFRDFNPILDEFAQSVEPAMSEVREAVLLGQTDHSTATTKR